MLKTLLVTVIAFTIFGCGKDPLTQVQKDRLMNTVQSVGNVSSSVESADQQRSARNVLTNLSQVIDQQEGDDRVEKMVSSLEQADDCDLSVEKEGDFKGKLDFDSSMGRSKEKVQTVKIVMTASGEDCPVSMDLLLNISFSNEQIKGDFKWDYTVLDDEFKKLNDIDSMSISGEIDIKIKIEESQLTESPWNSFSQPSKVEISGGAEIEGSIHSQEEGDIKFYLELDADGTMDFENETGEMKIELTFGFDYDDFTGEFKVIQTQKADGETVEYFLNDEEITEEEFGKYMNASSISEFSGETKQISGDTEEIKKEPEL